MVVSMDGLGGPWKHASVEVGHPSSNPLKCPTMFACGFALLDPRFKQLRYVQVGRNSKDKYTGTLVCIICHMQVITYIYTASIHE